MNRITIRGTEWQYEDLNPDKKDAILLVHGHPFDYTMWKYQYDVLKEFRLILPDLRGYGQSKSNSKKIYIEEQVLDLALLLDELNIKKVHLIGLSMGGQIIVEFHRLFPNRVHSLVICASTPKAETKKSRAARLALAETISEIGMAAYTKRDIHKYINLENVSEDNEIYKHLFKMMSKTDVKSVVASHKGRAERRDNFEYLSEIKTPTLVIAAEKDYFFKVDEVEKVARKIPNAQFEIISESGHLPNMEQPVIFNQTIAKFYADLDYYSKIEK